MRELFCNSVFFGVAVSILSYQFGVILQRRFKTALFNPLLIALLLIMGILLFFKVDYSSYYEGAKYLSYLLTPATVCLAIPLYEQMELLKKNASAILAGILAGVLSSMICVMTMAVLFHLTHEQ